MMTITVQTEQILEFRRLLNRALNTWEPANRPQWINDLEARVDDYVSKAEEASLTCPSTHKVVVEELLDGSFIAYHQEI